MMWPLSSALTQFVLDCSSVLDAHGLQICSLVVSTMKQAASRKRSLAGQKPSLFARTVPTYTITYHSGKH